MKETLITDTNSLIYSIKNRLDIRNAILNLPVAFEILIPECVIDELKGLSRTYWYAGAALKYSEYFNVIRSSGRGDDCILKTAEALNCYVLTNDRGLIQRLRSKNIRVLIFSQGKTIKMI
ncbi:MULTISPECIES: PIN domain-containing protein [Acidiplasma]|jgi:rRNA-processing protein FCF1|uniref:PIN domain-containing protein n=1 Tax=Acidiplasma cupricumulans TaxID=312540 RepID=A0A0Q0VRR3_9ARCH|nr:MULTISPECIES: PIN domain-containing protein [Acidiplasma]KQB33935.1 hypothetical protein AOG55_01735 [Acidiplasma cupricumulans]